MDKLIINAAITGMVPTRRDNPHVPISVAEIIADARRCRDAGASILHVHARDDDGQPTCDPAVWQRIIEGIREACPDLLISGSTSGRFHREFEHRSAVLEFQPDMASLTPGSLNFPQQPSCNAPQMIVALAEAMKQRGIMPELEFFEIGMIDFVRDYLLRKGIIHELLYANLLLGSLGTMAATPDNLLTMVRALPAGTTWSATGIGRFQFHINAVAVTMGGHVRVGLEDNLWFDEARTQPATNAGLIDRIVKLARAAGRDIATPHETRQIIGLSAARPNPAAV